MEHLVMKVMRNTITNYQQEVKEKLPQDLVALDVFLLDI